VSNLPELAALSYILDTVICS